MNRLSSHNKFILKDGKYILQEKLGLEESFCQSPIQAADHLETSSFLNTKTVNGDSRLRFTSREALPSEMTSSAIYSRKIEYVPKYFASRKIGQQGTDSIDNSPAKAKESRRQSNDFQTMRKHRVSFHTQPADYKSNISYDEDDHTYMDNEALQPPSIIDRIKNFEELDLQDKVLQLTVANLQLTEKLRQFQRKELGLKYHLSPQQEIAWLKQSLQNHNNEYQKILKENNQLQTEHLLLKERIKSLQRSNHILEIECTRTKVQLLTQDEIVQLCYPKESQNPAPLKDKNIIGLELEIERLKAEITRLDADNTEARNPRRSVVISPLSAGDNPQQEKINSLKKHISQKSNILDAYKLGTEKKSSLKNFIKSIMVRSDTDHKIIIQLRSDLKGKQDIIQQMDSLMTDISQQLATCKMQLSKQQEIRMSKSIVTATSMANSRHEKDLSSLSNSQFNGFCQSPIKQRAVRFSEDICDSANSRFFDVTPQRSRNRIEKAESQFMDDPDFIIRQLEKDCSDKQRIISRYEAQILRLNRAMNPRMAHSKSPMAITHRLKTTNESEYTPASTDPNSNLQIRKSQVEGLSSKTSVISIKRASIL